MKNKSDNNKKTFSQILQDATNQHKTNEGNSQNNAANKTTKLNKTTALTHSNYHTKTHSQRPPHSSNPQHRPPHGGPQHGNRPPQSGNRPPQHGNRPPQSGNRPPQQGGRPPQQGNRPPHNNRPPHHGGRPPQSSRPPQNRPPHNRPDNTITFPGSASIHKQRFERDFNFNNTTVLLLELENFLIETQNKIVENKINLKLEMQANNFVKNAITELYPLAVKDFLSAESNTYPFNPYASMLKYYIPYNQNCHLSTYRDNYVFTGGAHGTTQRLANTYNLQTGNSVPLSSFFNRGTNYKRLLLAEIQKQATKNMQQNPNIYFDDYINLINTTFNEESFYLTKNGLVIYYGQYDIAPYVTGIVEFTIPYSMLDNPPACRR